MQFFMAIYNWLVYQIGVRGDTASSTGSLHAKIKNMADKLGTSSDGRADNTAMGFLNTQVKSWQRVTVNPSGSSAVSVTLSSVNTAKCLVFINGSQSGTAQDSDSSTLLFFATQRYVSALSSTSLTLTLPFTSVGYSTSWGYGLFSIIVVELY